MTRPTFDDSGGGSGSRNVSWADAAPGAHISGALAYHHRFQGTVYKSDPPVLATWANGNPKMVDAITLVVSSSSLLDTKGVEIAPGDIVTVHLNSNADQKAYTKAKRAQPAPPSIGDRLTVTFARMDGNTRVKTFEFEAMGDTSPLVAEAVEEYEVRQATEAQRDARQAAEAAKPTPEPF